MTIDLSKLSPEMLKLIADLERSKLLPALGEAIADAMVERLNEELREPNASA